MKPPKAADPRPEARPGLAARMAATRLLAAIIDARTSLDGLTDDGNGHPQYRALDGRDRALVRAILSAALRHRRAIETVLAARIAKPLPPAARHLAHVLHVAAAQILYLDIPDSAAVDLAVTEASADPRSKRFAGLVNAVLRGLARSRPDAAQVSEAPAWFASKLLADWGQERTAAILACHAVEAPIDLTVKSAPELWAERLGGFVLPTGSVRLVKPGKSIPELEGFEEGQWWVQDAAAAIPARLFGDIAGQRVADLCAAPGGKSAQLAFAGAKVTAIDLSRSRLKRLASNFARLGLSAELLESDILALKPEGQFDAVLLDAPCSSTGTVRRHPDIPWTKTPEDVEKLAAVQRRLLDHAISLVRPGGRIVFSNCSIFRQEGEDLITGILAERRDIRLDPPGEFPGLAPFVTPEGTIRTLPDGLDMGAPERSGLDGFYAARLIRLG